MHLFKATKIIAISKVVADDLLKIGIPSKKIEVIYNGISFAQSPPAASRAYPHHDPYFVVIARHDYNKGLDYLIKEFALLLSRYNFSNKPTLVIVGKNGPQTSSLKKLISQTGLNDSVRMIQSATPIELNNLLSNSVALLSGSRYEGFNYTILEAQSLNTLPLFHLFLSIEKYMEPVVFFFIC